MLLQILINRTIIPVDNRQHFEHAALNAQHRQAGATAGLLATQTRKPRFHIQLFKRPVHRLDFVDVIVFLNALNALLPQFAVARFLPRRTLFCAINLQV
ncbi:hypothetical protein D3C80_1227280 [compost metagenome]